MSDITYVDKNDNVIGSGSRANALSKGIAHRIARILIFNSDGELLIQKRSINVDFPGKWDQSAAGHVDKGEDYDAAAGRELKEEVGISNIPLKFIKNYYSEETKDNIVLKRFNSIYKGSYSGPISFDQEEVSEVKWIKPAKLEEWMKLHPEEFTEGFIICFHEFKSI